MGSILEAMRKGDRKAVDPVLSAFTQSLGQQAAVSAEAALTENAQLKKDLAIVTAEKVRLEGAVESLSEQRAKLTETMAQVQAELTQAGKQLEQKNAAIRLEQETLHAAVRTHDEEMAKTNARIEALAKELQKERDRASQLAGELKSMRDSKPPAPAPIATPAEIPSFTVDNVVRGHDDRIVSLKIKPVRTN